MSEIQLDDVCRTCRSNDRFSGDDSHFRSMRTFMSYWGRSRRRQVVPWTLLLLSSVQKRSSTALAWSVARTNRPSPRWARTMSESSTPSSTTPHHNFMDHNNRPPKADPLLPTMIVFDLDDCLWSPEMYTLSAAPSIPHHGELAPGMRGVIGLQVPPNGPIVRLFDGARAVLYELATHPRYQGIILAAASSSEEPSYSRACLQHLEVLPGLTLRHMITYDQIGRTGQLSPDKRTHFRLLQQESGVPYEEMIFFDDCNWGDHCATITREFGVVSQRTPRGLEYHEFATALENYRKKAEERMTEVEY